MPIDTPIRLEIVPWVTTFPLSRDVSRSSCVFGGGLTGISPLTHPLSLGPARDPRTPYTRAHSRTARRHNSGERHSSKPAPYIQQLKFNR